MSCKLNNAFAAYVMIQTSIQCAVCHKKVKDKTQDTEPPPEDYSGFELTPNPAYGEILYVKSDKSQGEVQLTKENDDGNVYVSPVGSLQFTKTSLYSTNVAIFTVISLMICAV